MSQRHASAAYAGARLAAWAGTFVLAGFLGRATIIDGSALSLVWPAAGVAMLWIGSSTRRRLPADLVAFGAATFVVNASTGASPHLALVFVTVNLTQIGVFLTLTRSWLPDVWGFGGRRTLSRLSELGQIVVAAAVACLAGASLGAAGLLLTDTPGSTMGFLTWWGRNAVGLVAVGLVGLLAGPALIAAARRGGTAGVRAVVRRALTPRSPMRALETAALSATTVAVYLIVFTWAAGPALAFLVLAPTFWAGIRYSPLAATVHSLFCAAAAVTLTLIGLGPFLSFDDAFARALVAQLCVLMIMVAGLSLAFSHAQERQVAAELTSLMDASRLAALISTDLDGRIRTFGVGAERLLGVRAADVVDRATLSCFLDPGELAAAAAGLGVPPDDVLPELARREAGARTWTFVRSDGERLSANLALSRLGDATGIVTGYLGVAIDVTQAVRDERELAVARDRAERLFAAAPHGIAVLTRDGTLLRLNPALCTILGRPESDLVGQQLTTYAADLDDPTLAHHLTQAYDGGLVTTEAIWRLRDGHGGLRSVSLSSTLVHDPVTDEPDAVLTNVVDISEREHLQEQLAHLANHDPLTGLPNRRWFEQEIEHHLELCGRSRAGGRTSARGALLMLDLDHFKEVNDTLGHATGDQLLVTLADVLRGQIRRTDAVARLGGDEFAILLTSADRMGAERVAASVVRAVRERARQLGPVQERITLSVGGTLVADVDSDELLQAADRALYAAKGAGRNQYVVLDAHPAPLRVVDSA